MAFPIVLEIGFMVFPSLRCPRRSHVRRDPGACCVQALLANRPCAAPSGIAVSGPESLACPGEVRMLPIEHATRTDPPEPCVASHAAAAAAVVRAIRGAAPWSIHPPGPVAQGLCAR